MARFLCIHTLPPGGLTREDVQGLAEAGQNDPIVRGYRAFLNLTEGKAVCITEAPDAQAVGAWFERMGVPFDSITEVELEGERGVVTDLGAAALAT
jgi:hypothetical protein